MHFYISCFTVPHIDRLVHAGFYKLRRLRAVRRSVTTVTAIHPVNSIVVTSIDYSNSLLVGLPAYQLDRVQSVLNYVVHMVHGRGKCDHVKPLLLDNLHWLRVPEILTFKCYLLVY